MAAARSQENAPLPQRWLLLRGLGRETRHWFDFPEQLSQRLGVPVHLAELPGVGERMAELVPLSIRRIATKLTARLEPTLTAGSWGIVGISLGSMVALAMAEQSPEQVARLVLVNGSMLGSSPLARLRPRAAVQLVRAAFTPDLRRRERIIYRWTTAGAPSQVETWARRAQAITASRPVQPQVILRQLVAAAGFRPRRVVQPVLVLSSRGDRLVSPMCSEALADFLGAAHACHPAAGHDLPLEAADWVIDRIIEWLHHEHARPPP